MSKEVTWVKVESKSHPGRCYYYDRVSKASTWERPPELRDLEIPSHPGGKGKSKVVADSSSHEPLQNAWSQSDAISDQKKFTSDGKKVEKPVGSDVKLSRHIQVKQDAPRNTTMARPPKAEKDEVEEAMEVERWGEEKEVAMDIDVSQEDIADMKSVRNIQSSPSQLDIESFGIPADYTNDFSEKLYLVLDTNVLLSHLNFLEELKDYAIKGVGKPVLVIPWIVMQELDKHKTRGNSRLAGKARKAVRLLFSCFTSNHPRVRCQTMEETQTEIHNVAIQSNDDRILHCCLLYQLKIKGHSGVVVLFSNDLSLCSKALGNGVTAADRTTLFKELRALCQAPAKPSAKPLLSLKIPAPPATSHAPSTVSVHMTSPPLTPFYSPTTPHMTLLPQPGLVRVDSGLKRTKEVSDLLSEAESIVRDTLTVPLKQEMINAFDNLWSTMVAVKPPWALKDQLFLIEKHWIAVYGQVLPHHTRAVSSQLWHSVRNRPGVPTVEEAMLFTGRAVSLLHGFRDCTYHADSVQKAVSSLNLISKKLQAIKKRPVPVSVPVAGVGAASLGLQSPTTSSPQQLPIALVSPMTQFPPSASLLTAGITDSSSSLPLLTIPSLTTSSHSLQHMKEKLTRAVQSPPTDRSRCLEWVLRLVHDSVIYSQSMVHETLGSSQTSLDCANVSCFVRQIGELLSQIVTSLQNLFEQGVNIPRMQETLVAFDFFLCQALLVNSPLTIETFFEMISIPEQRQLMETALKTYSAMLAELHTIDASFQL